MIVKLSMILVYLTYCSSFNANENHVISPQQPIPNRKSNTYLEYPLSYTRVSPNLDWWKNYPIWTNGTIPYCFYKSLRKTQESAHAPKPLHALHHSRKVSPNNAPELTKRQSHAWRDTSSSKISLPIIHVIAPKNYQKVEPNFYFPNMPFQIPNLPLTIPNLPIKIEISTKQRLIVSHPSHPSSNSNEDFVSEKPSIESGEPRDTNMGGKHDEFEGKGLQVTSPKPLSEDVKASSKSKHTINNYQTSTEETNENTTEPENLRHAIIDNTLKNTSDLTNPSSTRTSEDPFEKHVSALESFEQKFYESTFAKLTANSPDNRRENGISFVHSGLLMYVVLTVLSNDANAVDEHTRRELRVHVANTSEEEKAWAVSRLTSMLPQSSGDVKLRWASRLVLPAALNVSRATSDHLRIDTIPADLDVANLTQLLNDMVSSDSGGAMQQTFEEVEVCDGVYGALLTTLYFRARWRAAPTLLNGTRPFRDHTHTRDTYMFRLNDVMGYAHLPDWDAEVLEVQYASAGLSLVAVVPRGRSLRAVAARLARGGLRAVLPRLRSRRLAVLLPLYTLRMSLLLPNKLRHMGISRMAPEELLQAPSDALVLSHAVQRIMFWAEAGRDAFKDDGLEWDEPPEMTLVVDRPYVFFVRHRNLTLLSGNFVL